MPIRSNNDELIAKCAIFCRAAREKSGLTQAQFAKNAGLTQASISRIETASSNKPPSLETLEKIASAVHGQLEFTIKE